MFGAERERVPVRKGLLDTGGCLSWRLLAGKDGARLREMVAPDEPDRKSVCGSKGSLWISSHSAGERWIVTRVRKSFRRELLWEGVSFKISRRKGGLGVRKVSHLSGARTRWVRLTTSFQEIDVVLPFVSAASPLYIGTVTAPSTCAVGPFVPTDITPAVSQTLKPLFLSTCRYLGGGSSLGRSRYLQGRSRVSRGKAWKNSVFRLLLLCLLRTSLRPCYFRV
jgi:hypothetical protein